ncbi:hypothetical protein M8R20_09860 [Pseudomonas sp. R2.Fl]|nr:hypothetical protein [Pseudomonas sp. R2.Fl]
MDKNVLIEKLKDKLHPELVRQLNVGLPDDFALADNQNQNQGGLEEIANMKPEVLRSIGFGLGQPGEEVMDNQNQNQGKLEELLRMKPAALQNLRSVLMNPGEEVMDNQNQNQGSSNLLAKGIGKE